MFERSTQEDYKLKVIPGYINKTLLENTKHKTEHLQLRKTKQNKENQIQGSQWHRAFLH
jgi:hypothetical protein